MTGQEGMILPRSGSEVKGCRSSFTAMYSFFLLLRPDHFSCCI